MMNNPRPEWASVVLAPTHAPGQLCLAAAPAVTDEARFLAALPLIDGIIGQVCRRHHVRADEAEEFRSEVRMHFIARNYEVLRGFQGRASLATYVNVVVQRQLLDYRNRTWGRWRPSTNARRLGPAAVLLERLVTRDGWSGEQALEALRANHGVTADDALMRFCDTLATRQPPRRFVSEHDLNHVASTGPSPDGRVVRAERDFLAERVHAALERARPTLAPMDRLLLKMRFEDHMPVADIARALHFDQRRLYRRLERLLESMRARMAADGIEKSDVDAIFADAALGFGDDQEPASSAEAAVVTAAAEREGTSWLRG